MTSVPSFLSPCKLIRLREYFRRVDVFLSFFFSFFIFLFLFLGSIEFRCKWRKDFNQPYSRYILSYFNLQFSVYFMFDQSFFFFSYFSFSSLYKIILSYGLVCFTGLTLTHWMFGFLVMDFHALSNQCRPDTTEVPNDCLNQSQTLFDDNFNQKGKQYAAAKR